MDIETILKNEHITIGDAELRVNGKKYVIEEIDTVFIGEANPARDRAYAFIAIGIVLTIFTSRWFMAGGVLAVLAGIVTLFDSRRKYTVYIKTNKKDVPMYAGYDYAKVKQIKAALAEKTTS